MGQRVSLQSAGKYEANNSVFLSLETSLNQQF